MLRLATMLVMAIISLSESCAQDVRRFDETTLDSEGEWHVDVDFDGVNEKVAVMERNVIIYKGSEDVSKVYPYCLITVHVCCPAHTAYTTFNFTERTIYSEAHYGFANAEIHKIKKTENGWIETAAITPLSVMNKDLYPHFHLKRIFPGSSCRWIWGNGYGGFHYWLSNSSPKNCILKIF